MDLLNKLPLLILLLLMGVDNLYCSGLVDAYMSFDKPLKGHKDILVKFEAPLTSDEEEKCISFLKHKFTEETLVSGRFRQNNLADWMLQQPAHLEATTYVLLEIINDNSADLLWREFCIQKLALAISQPELPEKAEIECYKTLEKMAEDSRISFSGTALLGLYRLHGEGSEKLSAEKIISLAENVLKQNDFSMANKVTALQIAGLLGSHEALEYARSIVQSDKPIQLRISAIALLAKQGNSEDLKILKSLTQSKDLRLRQSSRVAVEKLKNHFRN